MSGGANLPAEPTPAFQYPNQAGAAGGAFQGIGNLNTNPSGSYDSAGSTGAGANLTNQGQQLLPFAQQTMQTAFDPQQALYKQLFQQQQDQGNVARSQAGVADTPYGAGLAQQGNQNFDINWQNQQLGRQAQGAQTAGSLFGTAGNAATAGTAIGQSVPGFQSQQQQQAIADFLAYLQGGTSATNAGTSQYGAQSQAAIGNQQLSNQAFGGIGQLAGNLLPMFLGA